jgi:hypothetical protein
MSESATVDWKQVIQISGDILSTKDFFPPIFCFSVQCAQKIAAEIIWIIILDKVPTFKNSVSQTPFLKINNISFLTVEIIF